jgi:hypothetical protein
MVHGLRNDLVRDPRIVPGDPGRRGPSLITEGLWPTTVTSAVSHAHAGTDVIGSTHTWSHSLGRPAIVAPTLKTIAAETAAARFTGVYVIVNDDTTLTVRVVSACLTATTPTLTATLEVSWW